MSGPGCPSLSQAGEGKGDGALKDPRHAPNKEMTQGTSNFRSQCVWGPCLVVFSFHASLCGRCAAYWPIPSTHSLRWFLEGTQGTGAHAGYAALPEVPELPGMCWPHGPQAFQSQLLFWVSS